MPTSEIESIFLSATATDCRDFRLALKAAVEDNVAAAKIHLQENWAEGAAFVPDTCRAKVEANDAYIGLFGHRYGWVPPGFAESITQLEWRWAIEHWPEREPPIFILLPLPGSDADRTLKAKALDVLKQEFPRDAKLRKRSGEQQSAFIADVKAWANGRILNFYATEQQLREKGLSCVQNWNLALWKRAAAGGRSRVSAIPGEELGRIGRAPQIDILRRALDAWRRRSDAPALAVAVHGPEGHGQLQFADLLAAWDEWDDWDEVEIAPPTALDESPQPQALVRWAGRLLHHPAAPGDGVDTLARALLARLARTNVVLVMRAFGQTPDRWARFVCDFWQPLVAALATQRPAAAQGRLLWFVVDHALAPTADARLFWEGAADAPALDIARVLPLPPLAPLAAADVEAWLRGAARRQVGPAFAFAQRTEIAAAVTTPDGLPALVYERLQRRGFWR